jgi:hypothetical protein
LASYPKAFSADQHGCTLLQYKDDLQLARPTQEDVWKELTSFSLFCGREDIRLPKRRKAQIFQMPSVSPVTMTM